MSFYRYLSSLRGHTYGCQGCGFSTKTKVVHERHVKRCVFRKRWLASENQKQDQGSLTATKPSPKSCESSSVANTCSNILSAEDKGLSLGSDDVENTNELNTTIRNSTDNKKRKRGKTVSVKKKSATLAGNAHKRRYRNYRCKECGFLSNRPREFLYHRRYVHNEKIHIHACDQCDYASKTKHKLIRHQKIIHPLQNSSNIGGHSTKEEGSSKPALSHTGKANVCILKEKEDNNNELMVYNTMPKKSNNKPAIDSCVPLRSPSNNGKSYHKGSEILHSVLSGGGTCSSSSPTIDTISAWNIPIEIPLDADDTDYGGKPDWVVNAEEQCNLLISTGIFDPEDQEVADINANAPKGGFNSKDFNTQELFPGGRKFMSSGGESPFDFSRESENRLNPHSNNKKNKNKKFTKKGTSSSQQAEATSSMLSGCGQNMDQGAVERYIKVLPGVGTDPVYGCSLCRYTQPKRFKVERHIRHLHLRAAIFKCPYCEFVCKRKTEWIVHKVSHSRKTIYACVECGYQTTFGRNYERHRRHHDEAKGGAVKCKYCSYSSTGEAAVQRHMTEFHQSDTKLREHAEAKALLKGQSVDLVQSAVFKLSSDEEDLTEIKVPFQMSEIPVNPFVHAGSSKRKNGPSKSITPKAGVSCEICGFLGKSKPHLLRHMVVHSKEAPHECTECGLRYKRAPDLKRHIRKKHNGNKSTVSSDQGSAVPFGEFSPNPSNLSHTELSEGRSPLGSDTDIEQNEPLNLSTKKHNEDEDLQSNMAYDSMENTGTAKILFKPESLKCNLCSYNAKWPSDLRRHKLIHSIEKRFKCTLCLKKFKFQGDLNKHMKNIHNVPVGRSRPKIARHSCDECNFITASISEFGKHRLLHRPKQPWACLFCAFKCYMRQDIGRHLEEEHPSEVEMYGDLQQLIDQTYCLVSGNCSLNSPTPFLHTPQEQLCEQQEKQQLHEESNSNSGGGPKKYKCPHCIYETESRNKLQTHIEIHGNLKRFMCPECGKRSNWIWDVRKHVRREHPASTQDVIQMSEEEAMSTLKSYLDNTSVRCRTPKELPPKLLAMKRRGSSQSAAESENKDIKDLIKSSSVGMKQEMMDLQQEYGDVNENLLNTEQHASKNTEEDDEESDSTPKPRDKLRPFKCSHCGKRSNWKWDLRKHIRLHCPGAKVIVLNAAEAKATINEVVSRSPPKTKGFSSKGQPPARFQKSHHYKVKKLVAEKSKPFKCSACGKRSNWRWDLNKHLRTAHPGGNAQVVVLNTKDTTKKKRPSEEVSVKQEEAERTETEYTEPGYKIVPTYTGGVRSTADHITNPISVDPLRLKRFSCSECIYRSNFKGDIKRHIEKKHSVLQKVSVILLPQEEALETLEYYNTQCSGRRSLGGAVKMKPRAHSLPAPLSGIDLLNMRSLTPDTGSIKTEEDLPVSRPDSASSGGGGSCGGGGGSQKRTINTYQCNHCVFWCTSRRSMEDHCRTHTNGDLFQCNMCGDKSDYKNSMFRHLRSKHGTNDFSHISFTKEMYSIAGENDSLADLDSTQESVPMETTSSEDAPVGFLVPAYKCKKCGPLRHSVHRYSVIRHFKKRHPEMDPGEYDSFIEKYETLRPTDPNANSSSPSLVVKGGGFGEIRTLVTPKKHHCKICPYKSSKKGLLQLHMSYHKPQPGHNLRCRHCPYYVSLSRMLHTHIRLHLEDQGLLDKTEEQIPTNGKPATTPVKKVQTIMKDKNGRLSLQCEKCPFTTFSKNDFIYHKQFHRPIPNAPHKCDLCPYWAKEKRILAQHKKVHAPNYQQLRFAMNQGKKASGGKQNQKNLSSGKLLQVSPCKSDLSEMSTDDAIEIASVKQQIISSKVKSVAVTPMKVKVSPGLLHAGNDMLSSYVVEKDSMAMGLYKKYYKCRHCPWTNVRLRNLKLHEKMHGLRRGHKGKLFQCHYCNYSVGNKGLLTHHVKVHSAQYRPGQDFVNDVDEEDSLFGRSGNDSTTEASDDPEMETAREGILTKIDAEETSKRVVNDGEEKLEMDSFPEKSDFYIKYSDSSHQHILERAVMKKWCCEKCPYATMKKSQFERHTQLHGSRQPYTCQYCDYSVPGYHLLLQHEKLHRMPNPNLLCIQSISNLMRLPEVPADIAAAGGFHHLDDDPTLDESLNKQMYENSANFTEPKRLYRCDRCPYSNSRRDHILAHLKFHMIRSEFKCPHCDYSVSKSHLLGQHIKIHFTLPGSEMSAEMPGTEVEEWEVPQILTNGNAGAEVAMETGEVAKVVGDLEVHVYGDENDNTTKVVDKITEEKENRLGDGDGKDGHDNGEIEADCPDTMWICQYCDRGFHSNQKMQRHEKLHLAGMVVNG